MDYIRTLAEAGVEINTQLVLCPGINDGKELEYSLNELSKLYPSVQSIAVVPVGVTKHREGLFDMPEYNVQTAGEVIDVINSFGDSFKEKHGTRLAFAADEFYILAQRSIPDADYYEYYPQIDNGVGLWTSLKDEAASVIEQLDKKADISRKVSIATGTAAYPLIKDICDRLMVIYPQLHIDVYDIKNDFYGHSVTVAGLVTAGDIIAQLKDKALHRILLIPDVMLMSDSNLFLDNLTVEDVEKALNVTVRVVSSRDGADLISKIIC